MGSEKHVDAERFSQGLSYQEYVSLAEVNREWYIKYYDSQRFSPADRQFFAEVGKKLGTKIKLLALAEDWCTEAYRYLPIAARIAEACPDMELRVFQRDKNLDIMNQYLNQGQYQSIPTLVFFDENFKEIGRWIERPASGNAIAREIQEIADRQNLTEPQIREIRSKKMNEEYAMLSAEFIKEIKEILS